MGSHPMVTVIVLDIADQIYFYKHLMYNIGLLPRGPIITICDSDAVVSPLL
jgi:hypothetical protein